MAAKLVVSVGQGAGRQTILSGEAVVIGRSSTAQVVVDDAQVSRRHAECRLQAGQWFIHDLGSANGTFVNGRRLAADEMLPLRAGDRLRLGKNVELSFETSNEPAPFVGYSGLPEPAVPARSSKSLVTGIIAVVVLLAAVGAFLLWRGVLKPGGKAEQLPAVVTTPQAAGTSHLAVVASAVASVMPAGAKLPTVLLPTVAVTPPPAAEANPTAAKPPPATSKPAPKATAQAAGNAAAQAASKPVAQATGNAPAQSAGNAAAQAPSQNAIPANMGAPGQFEQLPAMVAQMFPGVTPEQLPAAIQQALQSGQMQPGAAQQFMGALFPGVPPGQLGSALIGSFGGFSSPQIQQILGGIFPGQNLPVPQIPTGAGAVAFTVWEGNKPSIYLMNADGSGKQLLVDQASEPAFSPDGRRLVYHSWREDALGLHVRNMDTGADSRLTNVKQDFYPSWSPDGNRLVFWEFPTKIITINADGSDRRFITNGQFPAWSPAGNRIAMKGCIGSDCGLILINPDGSNPVRITTNANDGQPAWSPNGQDIAFVSNRDGNWEIYAVKADGSWLRRITDDPHTDGLPAWASDGMRIAFRSDRTGVWAIYTATGVGGPPVKLIDAPVNATGDRPWEVEKISWR
jgi:hypothetical protein